MNIIEISVGNKKYKISCKPGEESHIQTLSEKLDEKYKKLSNTLGHKASENLILVIIALMLSDEVESLKKNGSVSTASNSNGADKERLSSICKRIDETLEQLESLNLQ